MTRMTSTRCTSTIAWRFTTCTPTSTFTECAHARIVSSALYTSSILTLAQVRALSALHSRPSPWSSMWLSLRFDLHSFYFSAFLLSFFLSPFFYLSDEQQPELNQKIMENLRNSAANGGEGTYDVLYLSTGYEPNGHDFNKLQNSSAPPLLQDPCADQDVDDLTLGEMLTETYRGQVDYSVREGVSVSQSSSSLRFHRSGQPDVEMVDRSGQPDECYSSNAQIRTLLEEQRQTILAECHARVSHHEFQAAQAEEERRLLQGQLWQQNLEFREAHQRSLTEMEELRRFQSSAFDTMARRKFIEDQNTILELGQRVQELQSDVNCMNDSKDFQDAESIRSGKFPRYQSTKVIPYTSYTWRDVEAFIRIAAPQRRAAMHLGHTWYIGKRVCQSRFVIIRPYPQELHQWNSSREEPLHLSTVEKSEKQEQDQDLRCQCGPSAKDSVILSGGDSSKNYGQTNNDCRFRIFILTNSLHQLPLLAGR